MRLLLSGDVVCLRAAIMFAAMFCALLQILRDALRRRGAGIRASGEIRAVVTMREVSYAPL